MRAYFLTLQKYSKFIDIYLYDNKKNGMEIKIRKRTIDIMDLCNIFVWPMQIAWDGKAAPLVSLSLMPNFQAIDPHYLDYQSKEKIDSDSNDRENDNYKKLLQEV